MRLNFFCKAKVIFNPDFISGRNEPPEFEVRQEGGERKKKKTKTEEISKKKSRRNKTKAGMQKKNRRYSFFKIF